MKHTNTTGLYILRDLADNDCLQASKLHNIIVKSCKLCCLAFYKPSCVSQSGVSVVASVVGSVGRGPSLLARDGGRCSSGRGL